MHKAHTTLQLPFPALVGLEQAQQALLLLAIDPGLRGVVLAAPAGTGKSSLARGIRYLLGDVPFVEIPSSIDAENLLGGLDLEATLRARHVVTQPGVLARANGGLAYVEGINLMTDGSANLLLAVLDEGEVVVERESISMRSAAKFSLIASYDPSEGLPRQHLLDRVGLISTLQGHTSARQRADVIRRNMRFDAENWHEDTEFLQGIIAAARDHLPLVSISDQQIEQISTIALQFGVEGQRADLFAVRAACAAAAYELRDEVIDADIELAFRLVILPRATQIPAPQGEQSPPPPEPAPDGAPPEAHQNDTADNGDDDFNSAPPEVGVQPEQILEALVSELPEEIDELPFLHQRRGRSGSRGSTEGNRGRHIRSIPGDLRRGRLDVVATLRAAAPWQSLRKEQKSIQSTVMLESGDIRIRKYRSKAGTLFCFAVDASGSMAMHRMQQAKGAVHTLLQKAYVNRDRVALIAFRGSEAELLMPPTQSVELAKRALDLLPTGGGTPLASALMLAHDVAQQAKQRGIMQTVLMLLTDGRGNVALRDGGNIRDELQQLGTFLSESSLHIIVVDTKRNYLSKGEARQLATTLGADYAYLPNASSEQIATLATQVSEQ